MPLIGLTILACPPALASGVGMAAGVPPDFITGSGWIATPAGGRADFAIAGGERDGSWWGHLEYVDHGAGLTVHGVRVTGYLYINGHTREICGLADSNRYGQVAYEVWAGDNNDNGTVHAADAKDTFVIRLARAGKVLYTTQSDSDPDLGSGDIELDAGNDANTPTRTAPVCAM